MKFIITLFTILLSNIPILNSFMIDINLLPKLNPENAISLVKVSTAILPQFDSIGHHVLHANQVLINKLLESNIDPLFKKKMILQVIDFTKQGDEMGGKILENYYNFIDYLL